MVMKCLRTNTDYDYLDVVNCFTSPEVKSSFGWAAQLVTTPRCVIDHSGDKFGLCLNLSHTNQGGTYGMTIGVIWSLLLLALTYAALCGHPVASGQMPNAHC